MGGARGQVEHGVREVGHQPGADAGGEIGSAVPWKARTGALTAARSRPGSSCRATSATNPADPPRALAATPRASAEAAPGTWASSCRPVSPAPSRTCSRADSGVSGSGTQVRGDLAGQLGGRHLGGQLREAAPSRAQRRHQRGVAGRPPPGGTLATTATAPARSPSTVGGGQRGQAPSRTSRGGGLRSSRQVVEQSGSGRARGRPARPSGCGSLSPAPGRSTARRRTPAGRGRRRRGAEPAGSRACRGGRPPAHRRGRPRRRRRGCGRRAGGACAGPPRAQRRTRGYPAHTRDVDSEGGPACSTSRPRRSATWPWSATAARARRPWPRRCCTGPGPSTGWAGWRTAPPSATTTRRSSDAGISLALAVAPFEWKGHKVNLIDTPGLRRLPRRRAGRPAGGRPGRVRGERGRRRRGADRGRVAGGRPPRASPG